MVAKKDHPDYLVKAVEELYTEVQNTNSPKGGVMGKIDKETLKEAMREAMKEWLDMQFATFGRWSFYGICGAVFCVVMYFWIAAQGWHK